MFKVIEVEKTYFLPNGQPDEKRLQERVEWQTNLDRDFSTTFHITRSEGTLIDRKTSNRLGVATNFAYYGGWFQASLLHLGGHTLCSQYPYHSEISTLWREVIRPLSDKKAGGK